MPVGQSGVVNISKSEEQEVLKTVSTTHFTGAIVQNGHEMENVTGLKSNRIKIQGINIQSIQNIHYRLWLFATNGFFTTNIDTDTYRDHISLDIPTCGERLDTDADGALDGTFYFNVSGLDVSYEDCDGGYTLHALLQNVSATSKNAGVPGGVQIDVLYALRL